MSELGHFPDLGARDGEVRSAPMADIVCLTCHVLKSANNRLIQPSTGLAAPNAVAGMPLTRQRSPA
jgi:hypothetical protein